MVVVVMMMMVVAVMASTMVLLIVMVVSRVKVVDSRTLDLQADVERTSSVDDDAKIVEGLETHPREVTKQQPVVWL